MPPDSDFDSIASEIYRRIGDGEPVDADAYRAHYPQFRAQLEELFVLESLIHPDLVVAGAPASRLGDFRIVREIGRGGMARVFEAEQLSLKRRVAVKVLEWRGLPSEARRERFRREAEAAATLHHPGIVPVYAFIEDAGRDVAAIVMERVQGPTLAHVLQRLRDSGSGSPTRESLRAALGAEVAGEERHGSYVRTVCTWVAQLADALDYAHGLGVVHRDVKPANVLLRRDGSPVLTDFGLAHLAGDCDLTRTGDVLGTPAYMSPEQIESSAGEVDGRTDVYSLGVILYELLLLRRPFDADTGQALAKQVLEKDPPAPRAVNPRIPRDLETVVLKALEKERGRRYATAKELADDLRRFLEFEPVRARPAGPVSRTSKFLRRHRGYAMLAAAGAASVLVLAGSLVVQSIRERTEAARLLTSARSKLEAYRIFSERMWRERSEIEADAARYATGTLPAEKSRQHHRAGKEFEERRVHQQKLYEEVLSDLRHASVYLGSRNEIRRAYADAYFIAWLDAKERGDAAAAAALKEQVIAARRSDSWYEEDLRETAWLSVETDPPGAEVYLFRYVEDWRFKPGGEFRRIPVPCDRNQGYHPMSVNRFDGLRPGTISLVVEKVLEGSPAASTGLEPGDLITHIDGHPIEGTVFVGDVEAGSAAEAAGVRRMMRVESVDGKRVSHLYDAIPHRLVHDRLLHGSAVKVVLDGAGRAVSFECEAKLADHPTTGLGIWPMTPERVLGIDVPLPSPLVLDVVARSGKQRVVLPGGERTGLRVWTTSCPLICRSENRVGLTPVAATQVPAGSYLLLFRLRDGYEDLRLPVLLRGGEREHVLTWLNRIGTTPDGMVFIPSFKAILGGDPHADRCGERRTDAVLRTFFIARDEVTVSSYYEFLNCPEAMAARALRAGSWKYPPWPRSVEAEEEDSSLSMRGADGRFTTMPGVHPEQGLRGVSLFDARDFCTFFTRVQGESRVRGTYRLPYESEWEAAARGADGRWFPWGDDFDWDFCSAWHPRGGDDCPPGAWPRDESPFGVRDLAGGNAVERCETDDKNESHYVLRGGSGGHDSINHFRAASRVFKGPDEVYGGTAGFRVACDAIVDALAEDRRK